VTAIEEIVGRMRDGLIVLDSKKQVSAWWGAAQDLLGWSESEATGREIDDLLEGEDANGNKICLGPQGPNSMLRISKAIPEQEVLVKTKSGRQQWIGVTTALDHAENGDVVQSILVARDISKRKMVDLAKSEVISAVSHELRSPLSSVKGFTQTLLHKWDRFDDETKKHLLTTINTDADRVTRLINELLDISRLEAGRLQLRKKRVDLKEVAEGVLQRLQARSETHKLKMHFEEEFPKVFADPDKIEQVLTNLVENAVKYTDEGDVTVSGSFDNGSVTVAVSDQGEGIPKDQRIQVFGKFFRRGERAGNPTGTGLGLYISKGLVEAHGGKIWVEEAPAGGAVFRFTLPLAEPAA
jgi:PAS domain S-box-containing protein